MQVMVRADASTQIGIGHVTRCLTLADALRAAGARVCFSSRKLAGNAIPLISAAGFEVSEEDPTCPGGWDWLVVDHYGLDRRYEAEMRRTVKRILVIDDLADRPHDCDVLLDQNLYPDMETRYQGLVPAGAVTLTGPQFALLRREFVEARREVRRAGCLSRVLVSFGGSDPTNETTKVLEAMRDLGRQDLDVIVLEGVFNPNRDTLRSFARDMRGVTLLDNTNRMSRLMLNADLCVGGGGATTWERCCLGLPSLCIAVASNQRELSAAVARRGYQRYLGESATVTAAMVREAISGCLIDYASALAMGLRGMQLVDGEGAARVLAAMEAA